MLHSFFNKAATQIDHARLAVASTVFVVIPSIMMRDMDMTGPSLGVAMGGAAYGTACNIHKDNKRKEDGLFVRLFNYYGFKNDKPRMGLAFGIGAVIGSVAGEFTRVVTGSDFAGKLVAMPLAYGASAVISATSPNP
jgi:hypothetical protein